MNPYGYGGYQQQPQQQSPQQQQQQQQHHSVYPLVGGEGIINNPYNTNNNQR